MTAGPLAAGEASEGRPRVAIGVTGTDTGVGKTVIAGALAAMWRAGGERVGVLKPVETGVTPHTAPPDATRLRLAAGGVDALDVVCPFVYADAVAPLVAAERAGRPITIADLDAAFLRVARGRDVVIVEGAGGLVVPITDGVTYEDLCARWALDIIVVAANRLGVINHAVLTVRSAEAAGLKVVGLVLNTVTTAAPDIAEQTNPDVLCKLLPRIPIVSFPFLGDPGHIPALIDAAASSRLSSLVPIPVRRAQRARERRSTESRE
jgi:dethiobiotin synthetase